MKEKITRNEFFKRSALFTAGVSAAAIGLNMIPDTAEAGQGVKTAWPYPYATLDPEEVRILGHDNFWNGFACSAGAFDAIITALKNTSVGSAYTDFPTKMMIYGHGGGVGWGTICGGINGAAAAISLVTEKADSDILIKELFGWYTQALFPSTEANTYAVNHDYTHNDYDMSLTQNAAGSPLCHVSVTEWCNTAQTGVGANERKERCARLAGDCAAKAVEILNAHFAGTFVAEYVPPATIAECNGCHGGGGIADNVAAQQDCVMCHGTDPHTVGITDLDGMNDDMQVKQNFPNPFGSETTIAFNLGQSSKVSLDVYDLSGKHIVTLIDDRMFPAGAQNLKWNGCDALGNSIPSGMYVYRMRTGQKTLTKSMMKL